MAKWQKGVTQGAVSCHFSILTKNCFICINHVYLLFRDRYLLISTNMIYTNGAHFDRIPNDKIRHFEPRLSAILF